VHACACVRTCDGREGRRRNAPAFERGQLAQLDPPKPMIAKRAQERILLESCAQRLRIERPNAPSQPRAPPTCTISTATANATTSRNTRIPRDEQRAVGWLVSKTPKQQPREKKKFRRGRGNQNIFYFSGWGWLGWGRGNALFVIGEERLDGRCVRQRAVERIKGVKGVFGTARRTTCLDRVHGAARERRCPIYIFIFMHRDLGVGTGNTCICRRRRRRRRRCRFCSSASVSNHPWRYK